MYSKSTVYVDFRSEVCNGAKHAQTRLDGCQASFRPLDSTWLGVAKLWKVFWPLLQKGLLKRLSLRAICQGPDQSMGKNNLDGPLAQL